MKLILLITLAICISSTSAFFYKPEFSGNKYQSLSASSKRNMIQDKINSGSSKPAEISLLKLAALFVQDNNRAFDTVGDDMAVQGFFPLKSKRDKLIHFAGMVAQVTFESKENHPYTGIFKGVDNAFTRFSLAKAADKESVAPGFVFKFLRNSTPSANIFSMYALAGQSDSSNIFEHDMTSHVPMINSDADFALKLLAKNFEKTSDYPTMLGLSDSATYDQFGKKEASPVFPFRLVFHPSKQAHQSMGSNLEQEGAFFVKEMQGKKFDTLFEVYAQSTPYDDDLLHIGNINMKTAFQSSDYADQTMQFQHQRFEEDLQMKPEWKDAAEDILADQEHTFPQYHFTDIGY